MKNTVIYGLFCPVAGAVRYIGKSSEVAKRFKMHLYMAHTAKTHKDRWLCQLFANGLKPSLVILEEVEEGSPWEPVEQKWISKALEDGWPITNFAAGGNGCSPLNEAARSIRKATMSAPETREKMSAAAKARWNDPEKRKRAEEGLKNRPNQSDLAKKRATPEYRKMMSERSKAAWADNEKRARIVGGITEETRKAVSEASRKMWANADEAKRVKMRSNLESTQ